MFGVIAFSARAHCQEMVPRTLLHFRCQRALCQKMGPGILLPFWCQYAFCNNNVFGDVVASARTLPVRDSQKLFVCVSACFLLNHVGMPHHPSMTPMPMHGKITRTIRPLVPLFGWVVFSFCLCLGFGLPCAPHGPCPANVSSYICGATASQPHRPDCLSGACGVPCAPHGPSTAPCTCGVPCAPLGSCPAPFACGVPCAPQCPCRFTL